MLTQDVPVSEDYVPEIQRYEKEIFEDRFANQRDGDKYLFITGDLGEGICHAISIRLGGHCSSNC